MARLVFDIETSALPPEAFDPTQQEYLFREAEKLPDPAAGATAEKFRDRPRLASTDRRTRRASVALRCT